MPHAAAPAEPSPAQLGRWLTLIAVTYSVFVAYGSLVPLDPKSLSFADASLQFSRIPYLSLGAMARADWVANILLYIPLAFFWCARTYLRRTAGWPTIILVLILCPVFAVTLEFLQLWFPPRTVSQNDLLAETLGTVTGVALWLVAGRRLIGMAMAIVRGGRAGLGAALTAYCLLYFIYSLLPFDFLVSGSELSAKLASDAVALFVAPSCGGVLRCGANLTLETASFVPIGLFLALLLKPSGAAPASVTGLLLGVMAGAILEGMQILLASGISQGVSVGTRGLGLMAGIVIGRAWSPAWLTAWLPAARALVIVGLAGYLLLLAAIAWRGGWQIDGALLRLGKLNWLPFYYHYYTTEQAAVISLMRNAVLYAPAGLAIWTWQFAKGKGQKTNPPGAGGAIWLGGILAFLMETSRLFKSAGHADPTNVLIGAVAAWISFRLAAWFAACLMGDEEDPSAPARRTFLR